MKWKKEDIESGVILWIYPGYAKGVSGPYVIVQGFSGDDSFYYLESMLRENDNTPVVDSENMAYYLNKLKAVRKPDFEEATKSKSVVVKSKDMGRTLMGSLMTQVNAYAEKRGRKNDS